MPRLSKLVPRKSFAIIFLIFSILLPTLANAGSNGIEINLGVEGCDNNGLCQGAETLLSCPSDCTPVVPPPPGAPIAYPDGVNLYNISVAAEFTTATIYWESSVGTISTIKWGETTEVKEGVLTGIIFSINHKVEIVNLKPGTMYYFTIESKTITGRVSVNPPVFFFTKFLVDTTFPLAPRNVKATTLLSGINLTWQNPPDDNFSYVRIMRHEDRYRGDPFQGKLIYEGTAQKFLDKNVTAGKKYFYVLFARNKKGDFSSGVGVSATAFSPVKLPPEEIPKTPPVQTPPKEPTGVVPTQKELEEKYKNSVTKPEVTRPTNNFFVHQYNQEVVPLVSDKIIDIDSMQSTVVDTATKTLVDDWLEITDVAGQTVGEYLFSYNSDSGRYQSVVPPLLQEGIYNAKIYRYENDLPIKISEGKLSAKKGEAGLAEESNDNIFSNLFGLGYIFWLILIFFIFILIFLFKRRRKNQ